MDKSAEKSLDDFFSQYPIKQYNKGQLLIYAHEDPSGIFYLESGSVRKYDIGHEGDEVVLNVFTAKIFFPISWAINKTPNGYFFEAATPIQVRRAPVDAFNAFLAANPSIVFSLLKKVYKGLEDAQHRTVLLMSGDAHDRLLFELFIEARRSGEMQSDGSCVVNVSLADLAQRAGLTRETISRELGKIIQSHELISRQNRSLVISDLRALKEQLS
ncbi:cAMP-activated global transcriptional regulator CRP [compost metagenome]